MNIKAFCICIVSITNQESVVNKIDFLEDMVWTWILFPNSRVFNRRQESKNVGENDTEPSHSIKI